MKEFAVKNRITAFVVATALLLTSVGGIGVYRYVKGKTHIVSDFVNKDVTAELGTSDNPFTILEIVPDISMGYYGYYFHGQEPVDLSLVGYAYDTYNNAGIGQFVNGKAFEYLKTSPNGGAATGSNGEIYRFGYTIDVVEKAVGLVDRGVSTDKTKDNKTYSQSGSYAYVEEGYFEHVEEGSEGTGHYKLVDGKFVPVMQNFLFDGSSFSGNVQCKLDKNPNYVGNESGADYNWVQTGYFISNDYNDGNNWLKNNTYDGFRGSKNEDGGYSLLVEDDKKTALLSPALMGLSVVNNNFYKTSSGNIAPDNSTVPENANGEVDGGKVGETPDVVDVAGSVDPATGKTDVIEPIVSNTDGINTVNPIDSSNPTNTVIQGDSAGAKDPVMVKGDKEAKFVIPEDYEGLFTIDEENKFNCADQEFFEKYEYCLSLYEEDLELFNSLFVDFSEEERLAIVDLISRIKDGAVATSDDFVLLTRIDPIVAGIEEFVGKSKLSAKTNVATYKYYNFTGSETPVIDIETTPVNQLCLESETPGRFYMLRAESQFMEYRYNYIVNTGAFAERLFENENPSDVSVQVITVTTEELRNAVSGDHFTDEGKRYKDLIDYADYIALTGNFGLDEKAIYTLYVRSHPDYMNEHPQWNDGGYQNSLKMEYQSSDGTFVNDIPGVVAYEIFLRQANALDIEGIKPAAVAFDNLNKTGDLANGTEFNYLKVFPLLMEYSAYYLYSRYGEDIWLDDNGVLWANRHWNGNTLINPAQATSKWYKQMFEEYSSDINNVSYGGGQIISGNNFTYAGSGVFDSNYNTGSAISAGWKAGGLFDATFIDDEYKSNGNATALTVMHYLLGINDNYKDHINVLELQLDDGKFISGYEPDDRLEAYYNKYELDESEMEFYQSYLTFILPWFTGKSCKYVDTNGDGVISIKEKQLQKFEKDFTIDRMTVNQFNSSTMDIAGNYDLIIFGSGVSSSGDDLTNKKYFEIKDFYENMGAVIFDSDKTSYDSAISGKTNINRLLDIANSQSVYSNDAAKAAASKACFKYKKLHESNGTWLVQALTYSVAEYKAAIQLLDIPDEYESILGEDGILTGQVVNGNLLSIKFKFKGQKKYNYGVRLYLDRDGVDSEGVVHCADNVFDGTIKNKSLLNQAKITDNMGTEAVNNIAVSGETNTDGTLRRNKTYTITCDVSPYKINGYLPYKVEVYSMENNKIHATYTGNTAVSTGMKTEVNVLQMCPTSDMSNAALNKLINISADGSEDAGSTRAGLLFAKYANAVDNVGAYSINVTYLPNDKWINAYSENESEWASKLMDYDIVILGFSPELSWTNNAVFNKGIENYINAGKSLIIGSNYLKSASNDFKSRAGRVEKANEANEDTQTVFIANKNRISDYPYNLCDSRGISKLTVSAGTTKVNELSQIDLESKAYGCDVVLGYNLAETNLDNGDGKSLFYEYNTDNITYIGMGESTETTVDEVKLLINTIVGSVRKTPEAPYLVVTNEDFYPNNVKAPTSTGYVELIDEQSVDDVEVNLKPVCEDETVNFKNFHVRFIKPTSEKYAITNFTKNVDFSRNDDVNNHTEGYINKDTVFSFEASSELGKKAEAFYFIELETEYERKGRKVMTNYIQKVQLLPMVMFDLY